MTEEILNEKIQTLLYFLTKNAARTSYLEFLGSIGISEEEYKIIKEKIQNTLNCKLYV